MARIAKVVGLEQKTTPAFRARLVQVSESLGIDPSWLAACIAFETAKSWSPAVTAGGGTYQGPADDRKAVGLIQFTQVALRAMAARGWSVTKAQLAAMTAEEQLTWVERYFVTVGAKGRMRNVGDVYMAIFAPSAIGKPDSLVLYRAPSGEYTPNAGLDANHDGAITRGEATGTVRYLLAQGTAAGSLEVTAGEGGDGAAGTFFPAVGCPVVGDELSRIRESVTEIQIGVLGRLDSINAHLQTLIDRTR